MEICWNRYRLGREVRYRDFKKNHTFEAFRPIVLVVGERERFQDPGQRKR